jgi:hypothetical protein
LLANEQIGLGAIGGFHVDGVPLQFFPHAVGNVPEVVRLCQQRGIFEI